MTALGGRRSVRLALDRWERRIGVFARIASTIRPKSCGQVGATTSDNRHCRGLYMYRQGTLGVVAILMAVFLFTGWSRTVTQSSEARAVSPIGVWDIDGVANSSTKWIAPLVLTQGENDDLVGHIDWLADGGSSGREYVSGAYDVEARVLRLKGVRVEHADNVVRCTYKVELSRDGSRLENGVWVDLDPTIPGTWAAHRIRVRS